MGRDTRRWSPPNRGTSPAPDPSEGSRCRSFTNSRWVPSRSTQQKTAMTPNASSSTKVLRYQRIQDVPFPNDGHHPCGASNSHTATLSECDGTLPMVSVAETGKSLACFAVMKPCRRSLYWWSGADQTIPMGSVPRSLVLSVPEFRQFELRPFLGERTRPPPDVG